MNPQRTTLGPMGKDFRHLGDGESKFWVRGFPKGILKGIYMGSTMGVWDLVSMAINTLLGAISNYKYSYPSNNLTYLAP